MTHDTGRYVISHRSDLVVMFLWHNVGVVNTMAPFTSAQNAMTRAAGQCWTLLEEKKHDGCCFTTQLALTFLCQCVASVDCCTRYLPWLPSMRLCTPVRHEMCFVF